jgi:hypothetical protein
MSLSMEPVLAFGQKRERKEVKFPLTQRLRSCACNEGSIDSLMTTRPYIRLGHTSADVWPSGH